jgi:anti-sigma factor RsiW
LSKKKEDDTIMVSNRDCRKLEDKLPELLLDSNAEAGVSPELRAHLAACSACATKLNDLRATMSLLDEWHAPEVSPYFDSKLAARLRSEKEAAPAGFFERLQARLMFGTNLHLKGAAVVAALAIIIIGGGSYAGFTELHQQQEPQAVSATINDLQILDRNDQIINQLDVLDDAPDGGEPAQN